MIIKPAPKKTKLMHDALALGRRSGGTNDDVIGALLVAAANVLAANYQIEATPEMLAFMEYTSHDTMLEVIQGFTGKDMEQFAKMPQFTTRKAP
jgi:hypothetical protein